MVGSEDPGGETLPVAYVVLREGADPAEAELSLNTFCSSRLNSFLVPAAFRFLSALPLTERGKLDYRALERETSLI